MGQVVVDTNVFVAAILNADGAPRQVMRLALMREITPLMGNALFCEYEDVLAREVFWAGCPFARGERNRLFDALLSVCQWIPIY